MVCPHSDGSAQDRAHWSDARVSIVQTLFFDGLGRIRASDDLLLYRVLLAALGVSLALADVWAVRVHDLTQLGSHVLQLPAV